MEKMIAYCGLNCFECLAYIATMKNDDTERAKVAELWSKEFNADIKPEDINCMGCISTTGPVFSYCNVCEIRKCGLEKKVLNCAYCDEYSCKKLNKFFEMTPSAKTTLDEIRGSIL